MSNMRYIVARFRVSLPVRSIKLNEVYVSNHNVQPLLMHITVGIVLPYLNSHTYILFVVIFTLAGGVVSGSDLLVCL